MDCILDFPTSTHVDRLVPKTAFYKHLEINAKLKSRFVEDIDRIQWLAKLAPSTLNVEDGKTVHEISVFMVSLKTENVPGDVFLAIDKQMPRHMLFILKYDVRYSLLLNYKEWADPAKGTFSIIQSFRTGWIDEESVRLTLDGSTMDRMYESFVGQISGFGTRNTTNIKRIIELQEQLKQKQRTVEALQKKVRAEKQFNRQLQLNAEARVLKAEVAALQDEINKLKKK